MWQFVFLSKHSLSNFQFSGDLGTMYGLFPLLGWGLMFGFSKRIPGDVGICDLCVPLRLQGLENMI